jgi:tetratricopeptide (TPR) repeat protein
MTNAHRVLSDVTIQASPLRWIRCLAVILSLQGLHGLAFAAHPEVWIEGRSSHFTVVTNANEHYARVVANQFETIRTVFLYHFRKTIIVNDKPVIIVAARDEATFKLLLPEYWTNNGQSNPDGVFVDGPDKSYVALMLHASMSEFASDPQPVYHEYVHYLMRDLPVQLPLWMVEGLAEYYSNISIERNKVLVGTPDMSNLYTLNEKALLPVSALFEIDYSSPYYNERNKVSIFYAESWLLTHYLITRDNRENTNRTDNFVELLGQNVPQAEAARHTIGDPNDLERALKEYVHRSSYGASRLDRPEIKSTEFSTRPLSEAESLAVRADFMAHDGHYAKAEEMLERSIGLDSKLVSAYEDLGFVYLVQGEDKKVEKWSAEALSLNPDSHLATFYYACADIQLKYSEGLHNEDNLSAGLTSDMAALTKLIDAGTIGADYEYVARYYRALGEDKLDEIRRENGMPSDPAGAQQALKDLDRVIAANSDISDRVKLPHVKFIAGLIAWNQLHVDTRAYSYWQQCADSDHAGCMIAVATGYTLGWEGVPPDPGKALEYELKAFESGTKYTCAGAHAARAIASLIYFTGISYPNDDDPVSWTQKSYVLSDTVERSPNNDDKCGGSEARIEEFLYRLGRGDRQNDLLTQAAQHLRDESSTTSAVIKYLSGSLSVHDLRAVVGLSKSSRLRCNAYFYAMWYAYAGGDMSTVNEFFEPFSKFDYYTCTANLVFSKKFGAEDVKSRSSVSQH